MIGRVAIYYRVSTKGQEFDSQEHEVKMFIGKLEEQPTSIQVFGDKASGKSRKKRPDFERMIAMARDGEFDTIVVYKLDRFSRDANTAIRLLLELDSVGVAFISVSQRVLNLGHDNPFRRTMLAAFAEIAQLERETIVQRIKAGLKVAKEKGNRSGPKIKYDGKKIAEMSFRGMKYKEISKITGASLGTISKSVKEYRVLTM